MEKHKLGKLILLATTITLGASIFLPYGEIRQWTIILALTATLLQGYRLLCFIDESFSINNHKIDSRKWFTYNLLITASIFLFSLNNGLHQFAGFDFSIITDPAWRMSCGQVPYRDFICTLPPGFYLISYLAFKLFSPSWYSIVLINSIYGAVTYVWVLWLFSQLYNQSTKAIFLSVILQFSTTVLIAYWWYNSSVYIAAVLYIISSLNLIKNDSLVARLSYLASLTLVSLMKPNVAFVAIVLSSLIMLFNKEKRLVAITLSFIALALNILVCYIYHISIFDMIKTYQGIGARAASPIMIKIFFHDQPFPEKFIICSLWAISAILLIYLFAKSTLKELKAAEFLFGFGLILIGIFATISNGESRVADFSLILIGLILMIHKEINSFKTLKKILNGVGLFCVFLAFSQGLMRQRIVQYYFDYQTDKRPIDSHFFVGFRGSPIFYELNQELDYVMFGMNKESIWFGPRLQWCYTKYNIEPPKHLPEWWDSHSAFPEKMEQDIIEQWKSEKIDKLIFFKGDYTYMPYEFVNYILEHYVADNSYGPLLTVYSRNQDLQP
jgi:hypothetical protein